MTSALIGHTGFVGGNLRRQMAFDDCYNSQNFQSLAGKSYDLIVCAGVNAVKWLANKEPERDAADIARLRAVLDQVEAREFILISTVDVYPAPDGLTEQADLTGIDNHAYGRHRLEFENWVKEKFPRARILRLPALFGEGLKKNIIYDLLNDNNVAIINGASSFQWYPLDRLGADLARMRVADLRLVNLATEPVASAALIDARFAGKPGVGNKPVPVGHYDLHTAHAEAFGGQGPYIMSAAQVVDSYRAYIDHVRAQQAQAKGLAVSNIAWNSDEEGAALAMLRKYGATGIEIAPTKIWPDWAGADEAAAAGLCRKLADQGFAVSSLQAILFGRPQARLFGDEAQRRSYRDAILQAADLAAALGADAMVLGGPTTRDPGMLDPDAAFDQAVAMFKELGDACAARNVMLCLEANPKDYDCAFATTTAQALALAEAVRSPGFAVNIDAGELALNGEDVTENLRRHAPLLRHMQASQPFLKSFDAPTATHAELAQVLRSAGYRGWVSIEMRRDEHAPLHALEQALKAITAAYGALLPAGTALKEVANG